MVLPMPFLSTFSTCSVVQIHIVETSSMAANLGLLTCAESKMDWQFVVCGASLYELIQACI